VASHVSAKKRIRQTEKRTARNRHIRSTVRTSVRSVRKALESKDSAAAKAALVVAVKRIDMAVSKGIFHARTGSRYVSRLSAQVAALAS
jgi:small subunit ribosomal protein S20